MINCWFKPNGGARIGSCHSRHESSSDDGPIACSDLWDLILDMDWDRVKSHCRRCPRDAAFLDGHWHETPLYLACQMSGPADSIRAIVQAYPDAVLIPSRSNHDLPLHIACRYQASVEVLEVLLQDFPVTSVEQTRWGKTPLMTLWEFRNEEMSEIEVEEMWQKAHVLLSAVARFRYDPRYRTQQPTTRTREFRRSNSHSVNKDDRKTLSGGVLQADSFVSKRLARDIVGDKQQSLLVHAAVSLGSLSCPSEVLGHVLQLHPEQAKAFDPWGLLPLHISVGPTPWSLATRRKYKPREQQVLQLLLQSHPEAANERLPGDQNRYPLHSAIANRHSWSGGVQVSESTSFFSTYLPIVEQCSWAQPGLCRNFA